MSLFQNLSTCLSLKIPFSLCDSNFHQGPKRCTTTRIDRNITNAFQVFKRNNLGRRHAHARKRKWFEKILSLTLFTPGGAHCAPPVTYLRITVQIHVRARWKNLTFPNYEFGIGHYAFYPMKFSRFAEKKYSSSEIPKFHKRGPLKTGLNASQPTKNLFWGF